MQTEEIKKETGLVDNVEALTRKIAEVRAAIEKFSTYTQEQVDKISLPRQPLPTRNVFRLRKWPSKKRAWAWSRIR